MSKYMQVMWMYLIGILIIFFGIIMLSMRSGPNSFVVMLVGLAVAAIGAAHGRRMRALGQMDMPQMEEKAPAEREARKPKAEEGPAEEKPSGPGIGSAIGGIIGSIRSHGGAILNERDIESIEMEDMRRGSIAPTSADVIELVCPRCMAENEEKNYYCFKCGNKLRKTPREKGEEKAGIAVEPGTISVVGDTKVAKVVICPKCNLANKVGDKYCWNCGKKIKSEGAAAAAAAAASVPEEKPAAPRRARHSLSEIDAIFSEPAEKRARGRKRKRRAKRNLKSADEIKS